MHGDQKTGSVEETGEEENVQEADVKMLQSDDNRAKTCRINTPSQSTIKTTSIIATLKAMKTCTLRIMRSG